MSLKIGLSYRLSCSQNKRSDEKDTTKDVNAITLSLYSTVSARLATMTYAKEEIEYHQAESTKAWKMMTRLVSLGQDALVVDGFDVGCGGTGNNKVAWS